MEKSEIDIRVPEENAWYEEPKDEHFKPIWKVAITPEMRKITETGQARFMPKGSQKSPNKVRRSTFEGSSKQPKSNKSLASSISLLISGATSRQMEREAEKKR